MTLSSKQIIMVFEYLAADPNCSPNTLAILKRCTKYKEAQQAYRSLYRIDGKHSNSHGLEPPVPVAGKITRYDVGVFSIWLRVISDYFTEAEARESLNPKERRKLLETVAKTAKRLQYQIKKAGLPNQMIFYLTPKEYFDHIASVYVPKEGRISTVLKEWDELPDTDEDKLDIWSLIEETHESHMTNNELSHSDLLLPLDTIFSKLSNLELLEEIAPSSLVTKTQSRTAIRIGLIRLLATHFRDSYGQELHSTIAKLCVVVFDDHEIGRDQVRAALRGFDTSMPMGIHEIEYDPHRHDYEFGRNG